MTLCLNVPIIGAPNRVLTRPVPFAPSTSIRIIHSDEDESVNRASSTRYGVPWDLEQLERNTEQLERNTEQLERNTEQLE